MKRKSVILSVTGASGVGKTSITRKLLEEDGALKLIVSTTTREHRPSDISGEYRYVTNEKFFALEERGEFLWAISAHGNHYGTLRRDIDEALSHDEEIFLILLTPDAIAKLAWYVPQGRLFPIFVVGPAPELLTQRLRDRGDDDETIARRMRDCADWERTMKQCVRWFYPIANDGPLNKAVGEFQDLIRIIRLGGW